MEKLNKSGLLQPGWSKQKEASFSLTEKFYSLQYELHNKVFALRCIVFFLPLQNLPCQTAAPDYEENIFPICWHYRVKDDGLNAATSAHPACPALHNLSLSQVFSSAWKNVIKLDSSKHCGISLCG